MFTPEVKHPGGPGIGRECTPGSVDGPKAGGKERPGPDHLRAVFSAVEKATRANRRVHVCVGSPNPSHQSPSVSAGAPGETPPECRKGGTSRPTRAKSSPSFRMSPHETGPNPSLLAVGLTPSPSPKPTQKLSWEEVSPRLRNGQGASAGPLEVQSCLRPLLEAAENRTLQPERDLIAGKDVRKTHDQQGERGLAAHRSGD